MYNTRRKGSRCASQVIVSEEQKMMKRLCAMLAALVMVLCAVSALAENAEADPVLVTVNGEGVRESTRLVQSWKNYLMLQAGADADE